MFSVLRSANFLSMRATFSSADATFFTSNSVAQANEVDSWRYMLSISSSLLGNTYRLHD